MDHNLIISKTEAFVRETLSGDCTGHDHWHVFRVRNTALKIAEEENRAKGKRKGKDGAASERKPDLFVVELAALLHDIADWKFHGGNEKAGPDKARDFLLGIDVDPDVIDKVCHIVENVSFKGAKVRSKIGSVEGMAVQDADRLDALGAIGIARVFATSAKIGNTLYDPDITSREHESFEEYKKSHGTAINHFYEKLLLLKDRMNTDAGKRMAEERHDYMVEFLDRFMEEWNGG